MMYTIITKLYKYLFRKRKPELMDRLCHFIVVQVFFVFTAILIIVLYPREDFSTLEKNNQVSVVLDSLRENINRGLEKYKTESNSKEADRVIEGILINNLRSIPDIKYAQLYFQNDANLSTSYFYQSEEFESSNNPDIIMFEDIKKYSKWFGINSEKSQFVELGIENNHIIYAYSFRTVMGDTAFLIVAVKHKFLLFDKTSLLWAILLLFLGTVLTALLMIYLLSNKFNKPYKRLVHGLEKTADGNMYYHLESASGKELIRLVEASNKLSSMLWNDHKKIEDYSIKLRDASISLKESQSLLGVIIENSPVGIITADCNGIIMVYNIKASELFGYCRDDAINRNISDLFPNISVFQNQKHNKDEAGFEVLGRTENGNLFPAYIISSPVIDNNKRIIAYLYMIRDISESKRYQEMMIRLDRYYIKGKMACDVAHEMNNYLAVLSGNLELMPSFIENKKYDKINEKLGLMQETVDNITRFSEGLVESDTDDSYFIKVDLNQLIENVAAFLKPQNRFDSISINTNLTEKMPYVEIDETQIQQVLVNIIENSCEAVAELSGNKEIEISTEIVKHNSNDIAEIIIKDNGTGVPEDKLKLMFKKRFTTRRRGRGIGLITCRKIMDDHSGDISYFYNKGAIIRIHLPITKNSTILNKSNEHSSTLSIIS